ncbi:MAG: hypothetical protein AAGF12_37000 [Myxococcota bacterium]
MMALPPKDLITIATPDGPEQIYAHVIGRFAVHPRLKGEGYTVTHRRTGYALNPRVAFQTFAEAQRCAEFFQTNMRGRDTSDPDQAYHKLQRVWDAWATLQRAG